MHAKLKTLQQVLRDLTDAIDKDDEDRIDEHRRTARNLLREVLDALVIGP